MKEMEQLVRSLQDALNGQGQAVTEMRAVINDQDETIKNLLTGQSWLRQAVDQLQAVNDDVVKIRNWLGADEADGPFYPEFKALTARVEELGAMIEGRNKSAPTKRNMTDADAIRVMTGDLKEASHKEAGEAAALTYAQVYSCRLEYTFKHVHKALKEADPEYKNKWSK
jgi:hypothetical protein